VVHRAEIVRGLPDLCAEHAQQDLLLVGHAVGNRDGELLALEGGQGRQGDGRVARGCFDQLPSGELFPGAQPFEQVAGGAVLDGAERIQPLELEVDVELCGRNHVVEANEGRRVVDIG
jgi:hypothetical protein